MNLEALSYEQKVELAQLLEHKARLNREPLLTQVYKSLYDWQRDFVAATNDHYESCLCAANQIGKTYTGTQIDAFHLLGDYPDDYPGYKFDFPPMCWGLGFSMEKTRDLLQTALFGKFQDRQFQGGLIPKESIIGWESAGGTVNAMRTVTVKHALGTSTMQFWSYSQGQHAIMGDVIDWVHVDEEPKDQTIRPQLITRTANGDKGRGGRIIYTFTPENGRTDLVIKFMDESTPDQFFMMKGWADAPHMDKAKQDRMLAQYPEHQRDMRTKGLPMLGHGRIYDLSDEFVECDPFEIPKHWFVVNAMDFGWDHPWGLIQLVEDRDTGCLYLTKSFKRSKLSANEAWGATKLWAEGVPTSWPQDGLQHEKGRDDSKQQMEHYKDAGFTMLDKFATWEKGGNSVEQGIYEIRDLASKGLFKVFRGQIDFMDEWRQYHRDDKGKIVKVRDDLLDPLRYAKMMLRFAIPYGDVGRPKETVKLNFTGWG